MNSSISSIQKVPKASCAPPPIVPGEGLKCDMVLQDGHRKMVGIQDCKVPEELLDLEDRLSEVHFGEILQSQILNPVCED